MVEGMNLSRATKILKYAFLNGLDETLRRDIYHEIELLKIWKGNNIKFNNMVDIVKQIENIMYPFNQMSTSGIVMTGNSSALVNTPTTPITLPIQPLPPSTMPMTMASQMMTLTNMVTQTAAIMTLEWELHTLEQALNKVHEIIRSKRDIKPYPKVTEDMRRTSSEYDTNRKNDRNRDTRSQNNSIRQRGGEYRG